MAASHKHLIRMFGSLISAMVILQGCGGGNNSSTNGNTSSTSPLNPTTGSSARGGIVVVVMEENHGYEQVIGNGSMPYFNSLAQRGALATQYYADAHPSIGNYLELTTGNMATTDDTFSGVISDDNLAREIPAAGRSWKVYAEDLPFAGYTGPSTGFYDRSHNPFAYFSDVLNNPAQASNIVPFTRFSADLAGGTLPSFSFVVPNLLDSGHTCAIAGCDDNTLLSQADQWLSTNISALLSSSQFQNGGLLLIVFDEALLSDTRSGGGHVAVVAIGPRAKAGFQSSVFYQHQSTLRTICNVLSLSQCPGAGSAATAESDMVQ